MEILKINKQYAKCKKCVCRNCRNLTCEQNCNFGDLEQIRNCDLNLKRCNLNFEISAN